MKLAILDRDGLLNALGDDYITSADDWVPVPGALEAIARLNHAGWHVVVATNQPGLGRGLLDVVALNAIHTKMHRQMAAVGGRIDAVFYCPHTAEEECSCRKPAPGLLEQICERYGVEPHDVLVVGNCQAHLQAGAALGGQVAPGVHRPRRRAAAGAGAARGLACGHSGACQPGAMGRATVARNAAVAACSGTVGGGLIL